MSSGSKLSEIEPIAIVGMSCIFPGAPSLYDYWQNIVNGVDSVREAASGEWNASHYKNKSSKAFGKIYCTKGGFISEFAEFNPLEFGIMPASVKGSDPDQFLALRVAAEALQDAGYQHKTFDAERADIIIGRTMAPGVGSLNLIQHGQTLDQVLDLLRSLAPQLKSEQIAQIESRLRESLQPCNADTIPAVMPNVLSGRIASKLGFRGRNLVLDAACASSLIAVEAAMQGLHSGQSDLAIAGGIHVNSCPYFFQMFCELGALSPTGTIRPFDENADGTILGEGVGMVVLKRLADAERDNNKIYALVRGIGSSSDGRAGGSLAPNAEGEALAMQRAYKMAGVSPRTIELLEAHGTGTRAGDRAEMKAVQQVFLSDKENAGVHKAWCAVGSVKSMIGHTQAASGIAGLIKTALALHQKVLPQTLHFAKPNSQIDWSESPCYISTETRPWKKADSASEPRRAAVSAFGFGGVNAHAVLEEYCSAKSSVAPELKAPVKSASFGTVKLGLEYPALNAKKLGGIQIANQNAGLAQVPLRDKTTAARPESGTKDQATVLSSYLQTLGSFQKNLLGVQEKVLISYLKDEAKSSADPDTSN